MQYVENLCLHSGPEEEPGRGVVMRSPVTDLHTCLTQHPFHAQPRPKPRSKVFEVFTILRSVCLVYNPENVGGKSSSYWRRKRTPTSVNYFASIYSHLTRWDALAQRANPAANLRTRVEPRGWAHPVWWADPDHIARLMQRGRPEGARITALVARGCKNDDTTIPSLADGVIDWLERFVIFRKAKW